MARIAPALAGLAVTLLAVTLLPLPAVAAAPPPPVAAVDPTSDVRELTSKHFTLDGHPLPQARRAESRGRTPAATPPIGTVREWLGLDDTAGRFYRKTYTLRGVGTHIEVWVADDLAFPAGDCRTDGITVTDT